MDLVVDHHDRRQSAGPQAGDRFHGEQQVGRGVVRGVDRQPFVQGFQDGNRVADVASGPVAETNGVLAARLEREVRIKRRHAEDPRRRQAQRCRHEREDFLGQIAILLLNGLKDGD